MVNENHSTAQARAGASAAKTSDWDAAQELLNRLARQGEEPAHDVSALVMELKKRLARLRNGQADMEYAHAYMQKLFQSAPIGYFVLDPEGVIEDMNQTGANLFGWPRHHMQGRPLASFTAANPENLREFYASSLKAKTHLNMETEFVTVSDERFWAMLECRPLKFGPEKSARLLCSVIDLTEMKKTVDDLSSRSQLLRRLVQTRSQELTSEVAERKQAQNALKMSEERFRKAFFFSPFPMMIHDDHGVVLMINQAWTEITGYTRREIPDIAAWTRLAHVEGGKMATPLWKKIFRSQDRTEQGQIAVRTKQGQNLVWDFSSSPLGAGPDGRNLILGVGRDITQEKRVEEALHFEARLNETTNRLARDIITHMDIDLISRMFLDEAKSLSNSQYGFVAYLDQASGSLVVSCMDVQLQEKCVAQENQGVFRQMKGLGDRALQERRTTLDNGIDQECLTGPLPEGHVPIKNFICAPATMGAEIVGQIALANAPRAFVQRDKAMIERLASLYAIAINRLNAEKKLKHSEQRLKGILDSISVGILIVDSSNLEIIDINMAAKKILGYELQDVIGSSCHDYLCEFNPETCPARRAGEKVENLEQNIRAADGALVPVVKSILPMQLAGRAVYLETFLDISQRKTLESQLRQAQKMEAVGRLAGGVAHDFNNILTTIIGTSRLLLDEIDQEDTLAEDIREIKKAGERAAGLTRQLLAFSRKQMLAPRIINLNETIQNLEKMLHRIIGEDIEFDTDLAPDLWLTEVDPSQVEQVIMNLAVNARDAMPEGGRLTISTRNIVLSEEDREERPMVKPGQYVQFSVTDTGVGMTKEVLANIFEPFFTTKEFGAGTGLGLATVYGIIKQSNGFIWAASSPGEGAVFDVQLPRVIHKEEAAGIPAQSTDSLAGDETIMVVEDESMVRRLAQKTLERFGYQVIAAVTADEALGVLQGLAPEKKPDLILTDVVMPGISGPEMAEVIRAQDPASRVVFMSGYTEHANLDQAMTGDGEYFLQKPFTMEGLLKKIRTVLDQ